MKKIILIILIILLTAGLFLWAEGNAMREIRTEVEIAAPPEKVWAILTDFESWKEWTPIINQASGTPALGSELNITMIGEDGKDGPNYIPVVTNLQEPTSFRWRAKMMSEILMTNDKIFELEQTATGTRLVHKELFKGMLVPLFWGKFSNHVPVMLNSMNDALKIQAETGSE